MPRRPAARIALLIFLLVALVDLGAEFRQLFVLALAARLLLMPLLLTVLVLAAPQRRHRLIIATAVALLFSWLGDTVGQDIAVKIVFFLGAQIAYLVAFWPFRRTSLLRRPALLAIPVGLVGALLGLVAVGAGPLAPAVIIYGASLIGMAVLATGLGRLTAIGALLFVLSDVVLAVEAFLQPGLIPHYAVVNMALYLPAQALLVLGVLRTAEPSRPIPGAHPRRTTD